MAFRGMVVGLVVVLVVAVLWTGTAAQSGCTSALTSLSPCLTYVTGSSSTPSSSCCSQLSSVVQSSPQCLCSLLNAGGSSLGITINQTLALSLPVACKVQTSFLSQCKGGNGLITPAAAPVGSSPQGAGSKTVPSIDGGWSGGSRMKVPSLLLLSLLFIASCVSLVTKF